MAAPDLDLWTTEKRQKYEYGDGQEEENGDIDQLARMVRTRSGTTLY